MKRCSADSLEPMLGRWPSGHVMQTTFLPAVGLAIAQCMGAVGGAAEWKTLLGD